MLNELRRNPLTRKWVIYLTDPEILPRLLSRYEEWKAAHPEPEPRDEECPYCPGEEARTGPAIRVVRDGKILSPRRVKDADSPGWDLRVVPFEGPALGIDGEFQRSVHRIYDRMTGRGANELIVEHPDHRRTIWEMDARHLELLLLLVRERFLDLRRDPTLGHQIYFRNSGPLTGVRWSHPHSQIVAAPFVPEKVQKELRGAHMWYASKERCLFCDVLGEELRSRDLGKDHRIVLETENFVALVPYFASHPFETWLMPRFHQYDFRRIETRFVPELAQALQACLRRLGGVLGPTSLTLYLLTSPNRRWGEGRGYWRDIREDWHWRLRLIPRLPGEVHGYREFFLGTGSRVNPVLPELAARLLRS